MNILKNHKIYLSGAIDRVSDSGIGWRKWLTPKLQEMGMVVFDPCNKPVFDEGLIEGPDFKAYKNQLKSEGRFDELQSVMKRIRNIDLRMVDASDCVIVNLDMDVHLCGTYEEIFVANRQKKPVLLMCPQGIGAIPDWLFGTLPLEMMFAQWDDLILYLQTINNGAKPHSRWVVWDWSDDQDILSPGCCQGV